MKTRSHRNITPAPCTAAILAGLVFISLLVPSRVFAQRSDPLSDLLSKTQANVEQFVDQFAYLRYQEDILQQKLKPNDSVEYKQETVFDALLMTRFEDGRPRIVEQRFLERAPDKHELRPLIKSDGFSTLAMIFHPCYQSSFRFKKLEDDRLDGQVLARVGFDHIPGTPSPILYQMIYVDRALELSGVAWIDSKSGNIHRIETTVGSSMADMGIKSVRAELSYGFVSLKDEAQPQWLPVSATVDLETPKQHWRNIHNYRNYKKYRTDIKIDTDVFPSR